jgi:hypothetical protein
MPHVHVGFDWDPVVVGEHPVLPLSGVCFCQLDEDDVDSPGHPLVGDVEAHLAERGEGS